MKKQCKLCKKPFVGRSDKQFCSTSCKSSYHYKLKEASSKKTKRIDEILHRNHAICMEIMGKNQRQMTCNRSVFDQKKFNFKYVTGYHLNSKNKHVNYIYNFSWIIFSDGNIVLTRHGASE